MNATQNNQSAFFINFCFLFSASCFLFCGCGDSAHERQVDRTIADLQGRVAALEAQEETNMADLTTALQLASTDETMAHLVWTNQAADEKWLLEDETNLCQLRIWQAECQAEKRVSSYPPAR